MIDDWAGGAFGTKSTTSGGGGGSGDVVGPASSTDNAIARFDGATGKLLQNSTLLLSDTNVISPVTANSTVSLSETDVFIVNNTTTAQYLRLKGVNDGDNYGALELWKSDGTKKWQFALQNTGNFAFFHNAGAGFTQPFAITDGDLIKLGITGTNTSEYFLNQDSDQLLTLQRDGGNSVGSEDAWTLLQIKAPTGTVSGDQEATLALTRDLGGGNVEFMDVYNNGYATETQYGLRIQKRGTGSYRNFVVDTYDAVTKTDIFRWTASTGLFSISRNTSIIQPIATTGSPTALLITGAAHTTLTASTEVIDVNFALARTVQLATGALTTERSIYMQGVTYGFVGASTITNAATLYVDPPVAGTNATITNNRAIKSTGVIEVASAVANQIVFSGGTGGAANLVVTASDTSLVLKGNRTAASGNQFDVIVTSTATRTTGAILKVQNNGTDRLSVSFAGSLQIDMVAVSGGARPGLTINNDNFTNQTASTEISNVSTTAFTRQWAAGTVALNREVLFGQATYAAVSNSSFTVATGLEIAPPTAGTNAQLVANYGFNVSGAVTMGASAATSTYRGYRLAAQTITFTGTTQITSTVGLAGLMLNQTTITNASAMTMDAAATLYIAGAPIAAGSVTLTNPYSIWVDAGTTRLDGLLDLSNIAAGSPNLQITATSDTPGTTWNVVGTNNASAAPSGFIEIIVGGNTRYLPFFA